MPTLLEQAKALRAQIDADTAEAKTKWSEFDTLRQSAVREGVDFTKNQDAFTKLDEAGKAYDTLKDSIAAKTGQWQRLMELAHEDGSASLSDLGVKGADGAREAAARSLGVRFTEAKAYRDALPRLRQGKDAPFGHSDPVELLSGAEVKTLLQSSGVAALFRNDKKDILTLLPTAPLTLLDVIPFGTTDSDTVEWQEESTFTNSAAETAEGSEAPESAIAYTTRTAPVQDITHFIPSTKRALADAGQAAALIDNRLTLGVRLRLQNQVVNGNGTSPNLRGIVNTSGILTQALGSDSRSDAVHKSITKIRIQGEGMYVPKFLGVHPTDAESLFLEKDTSGRYYFGGPAGTQAQTVWGLLPIVSTVFAQGTPLVFDEAQAQGWLNGGLEVAMSDSHSDYFTKKKVAVMASLRAAFGLYAPKGFCQVTGF